MFLQRIIISDFKNISSADIVFSSKINCICGNNGEGKTNLLDAIHYLSMTKSFLHPSDQFTYRYGASEATLHGVYDLEGVEDRIALCVRDSGEKIIKRNSKAYPKISEHIGHLPVVIISPSDNSLINDSGEERRRFMNIILSQTDKEYLKSMQSYNRVLQQRNKLLKQESPSDMLLDTFSAQLSKESEYIHMKRGEMVRSLNDVTARFYCSLSGGKESVSMEYVSDIDREPLANLLEKYRERDKLYRYTTVGIQRDDLSFLMDSHPMKKCASQGQQKTFLISLKMAQYSLMKRLYGKPPILLLDDVFDKLDMKRVEFLINAVAQEDFGQIFITDSNKVRLSAIVNSITHDGKFFNVENGVIKEMEV